MTREEAIYAVKVRIDELTSLEETPVTLDGDVQVKPVEACIEETLNEATDAVNMAAPLNRLDKKEFSGNLDTIPLDGESGIIYYRLPLPDDFLKIAKIRMTNWKRPCTQAVPYDSEAYRLLRNPHTTAGLTKPAVVVAKDTIELYGSRTAGDTLLDKTYIHRWVFDNTDKTVNPLILEAIYWRAALQVLAIMARTDAAKQAQEFYNQALNTLTI
jgi:hypothetical protein